MYMTQIVPQEDAKLIGQPGYEHLTLRAFKRWMAMIFFRIKHVWADVQMPDSGYVFRQVTSGTSDAGRDPAFSKAELVMKGTDTMLAGFLKMWHEKRVSLCGASAGFPIPFLRLIVSKLGPKVASSVQDNINALAAR